MFVGFVGSKTSRISVYTGFRKQRDKTHFKHDHKQAGLYTRLRVRMLPGLFNKIYCNIDQGKVNCSNSELSKKYVVRFLTNIIRHVPDETYHLYNDTFLAPINKIRYIILNNEHCKMHQDFPNW